MVIEQIRITDKSGNIKKQRSYTNGQAWQTIDVSELSGDVYVVSAFNGKVWISEQIIIQH